MGREFDVPAEQKEEVKLHHIQYSRRSSQVGSPGKYMEPMEYTKLEVDNMSKNVFRPSIDIDS